MPAVNVAMERSLRRGFLELLVASLRPAVERRDIQGQITDVKTAFSSWDNCMQVNYCKWPVIAVIIIGGLIIASIVWCIIRCACCGLSCCCGCFSCLKCCGNCCGCCDPPRGSRNKYLDEPYIPPHHAYKAEAPMHTGFGPPVMPAAKAATPTFPQYAEFETSKKHEDALPQMPSWEGAEKKKVFVEEEEGVEMNALKKPEHSGQTAAAAAITGAAAATSPANRTPYGVPGSDNDPYARGAPAYNQPGMAYGEPEQRYEMAGSAVGPGRQSPHNAYNNGGYNGGYDDGGFGQARDYPGQAGQGGYNNYGVAVGQPYDNYDNYGSLGAQGYGANQRHSPVSDNDAAPSYLHDPRRSPGPQAAYSSEMDATPAYPQDSRRSPAPQAAYGSAYGPDLRQSPAPRPQYGAAGGYGQDARRSPAPSSPVYPRQYSGNNHMPSGRSNTASPGPLRNDATGFDFTSGHSRPPVAGTPVNAAGGGYRMPSPAAELGNGHCEEQQPQQYPGYKPYQHAA
ncbi:hypothetical protein BT67DRAFT_407222 [Trichocladium antarcticum]|uniref:Fibroin-3 related protein n=1 Tax=Trichocladium antarcticum TaxID=1450529 RepID=A0AAN6UGP5_9PEZI|nr:hypothetical protein BT67DRAFT_407222 [Trichocladium antarcticum]